MWLLGSVVAMGILLTACAMADAVEPASPAEPSSKMAQVTLPVAACGTTVPVAPWSMSFHDGSGNALRLWKASRRAHVRFEFTPVQPEQSSTGLYSGGKPSQGRVDARRTRELWRWVRKLEGDSSLHTELRAKGTGAFHVKGASGNVREFMIEDGSPLREFTGWLRTEVVGPESYNPALRMPGR